MQAPFSDDGLLAARFHHARPGLELITIIDAALPVARVTAEVLAQDRKDLPLLEEFVLRLVDHKVTTGNSISGMLGLPDRMVNQTIAELFTSDNLAWAASDPRGDADRGLRLTGKGRLTTHKAASVVPVRVSQPLAYDQMLGKVAPYNRHTTIPRGQAEKTGLIMLPAARSGPVEEGDISASDITALLKENGTTNREVLEVKGVRQDKAPRSLPVKILVYADTERTDIQLGIVVDGELSHTHELELIGHGGAKALGITVEPPPERPVLEEDLERRRVPLQEVTRHRAEQAAFQMGAHSAPTPGPPSEPQPQADEIRAIGVFEHPEILDDALTHARRRLLIISPWIKNAIITTSFLGSLETRLARGVQVDIAYGYEDNDTKSDQAAVRKLRNLAERYPAKFTFTRLKSTHAKVLICDDLWVTTSFNWLSFKGDPERTYRMEEGSLVRNREISNSQHDRYLKLIDEHRK